ncbi:helix-turn-helix domain-containing protein [Solidesulfovibrio alcoholivorans]|uniref:helix-turn-helix domain-containing protein n=1 Tax=Solidesulfovibrio alcoholivorans TaxID=81406 RepID=UPI0012EB2490|nr:helix-turn-helix domain-containing protein [Solidesulfovibrio alcoholivorans]
MEHTEKIKELEIKAGLALAGLTVSDIARRLGVSQSHVQKVVVSQRGSNKVMDYINSVKKNVTIIVEE